MDVRTYTTKEFPFPYYGMKSYRIEIQTPDGIRWLQRHIWTDVSGRVEIEGWIPSHRPSRAFFSCLHEVTIIDEEKRPSADTLDRDR